VTERSIFRKRREVDKPVTNIDEQKIIHGSDSVRLSHAEINGDLRNVLPWKIIRTVVFWISWRSYIICVVHWANSNAHTLELQYFCQRFP